MSEQHVCHKENEIRDLKDAIEKIQENRVKDQVFMARIEVKVDHVTATVEKLLKSFEENMAKPSERYEKIKLAAIVSVVTGVIAYFLGLILSMPR